MTRINYLLLGVMFLAWLGMSCFFPYVIPMFNLKMGVTSSFIGFYMGMGVFLGNISSLFLSLRTKVNYERNLLVLSLCCFILSVSSFLFPCIIVDNYFKFLWILLFASVYRFSCGIYFNASRALQISTIADEIERLKLLSYIKVVNSVAVGLGPIIGCYAIKSGGYNRLNLISLIFFSLAFIMLLFIRNKKTININKLKLQSEKRNFTFYLVCVAAMLHFIFEAQIYSYMTMRLIKNNHTLLVPTLFTVNAITLISLGVVMSKFTHFMKKNIYLIIFGSSMSVISILLINFAQTNSFVIIVSILFSIGEFLTPQLTLDLVSNVGKSKLANISIFNFLTSGIGFGLGFFIGGIMLDFKRVYYSFITLGLIYLVLAFLFLIVKKNINKLETA